MFVFNLKYARLFFPERSKASTVFCSRALRIVLTDYETNGLTEDLFRFFERMVNVPRIMHGNRQSIDTLINEEALLFAKYLRHEIKEWQPRIADLRMF